MDITVLHLRGSASNNDRYIKILSAKLLTDNVLIMIMVSKLVVVHFISKYYNEIHEVIISLLYSRRALGYLLTSMTW